MPYFIGLKLLSVFSIGSLVASHLFLPMFFKEVLGLGSDKIGLIFSIIPFTSCFAFPFWTRLADRTHCYKSIMILNTLVAIIFILSISAVPWMATNSTTTIVLVSLGCFGYSFCGYPMVAAMVDCVTLRALGEDKALYGRQKIGCPIGVSTSVFLVGSLQESFGTPYALFWVYTAYALGFIVTLVFTDLTPYHSPVDSSSPIHSCQPTHTSYSVASGQERVHGDGHATGGGADGQEDGCDGEDFTQSLLPATEHKSSVHSSMWSLFLQPTLMHFYTVVALLGFCFSAFQTYLFIFIRNDLKGTPAMIAWLGPLSGVSEIMIFFFSKQVNLRQMCFILSILHADTCPRYSEPWVLGGC
ncbi:major facilitator superfamily domain-containing protein [Spinellus fusiger]|nr:major facilitator superfamily domain-containing protein [Spinellus fusiger]